MRDTHTKAKMQENLPDTAKMVCYRRVPRPAEIRRQSALIAQAGKFRIFMSEHLENRLKTYTTYDAKIQGNHTLRNCILRERGSFKSYLSVRAQEARTEKF